MFTREQEEKALWVLQKFSPGELQSRTAVSMPMKFGRKPDSPIESRMRLVSASRIPASTIARFQQNLYQPRERSIKKLSAFYDRYQYHNLRARGANYRDARRYARYSPDKLKPVLGDYARWVKQIQKNYQKQRVDVKKKEIQWGMAHSRHRHSEWDAIAAISGLRRPQVRARKSRRPGQYEH